MKNLYQRMTPEAYSLISKLQEKEREVVVEILTLHVSFGFISLYEAKFVCRVLGLPLEFESFEDLFLPLHDVAR